MVVCNALACKRFCFLLLGGFGAFFHLFCPVLYLFCFFCVILHFESETT